VADPDFDWRRTPVFWNPELAADVVLLSASPSCQPPCVTGKELATGAAFSRRADDGLHLSWTDGDQARIDPDEEADGPVAAIAPLDRNLVRRMRSADRLFRRTNGQKPQPPDMAPLKRANFTLALRVLHGRRAGASHREVASVLYERETIPTGAAWKSSDARSRVVRLATKAKHLANGGYMALLN
jgi:hypothetical protein